MFIIGHRGARAVAPENTLAALKDGMACADYVEVDVRQTEDGTLVTVHDPTVDRTTSGHGAVGALSLDEVRRLDAGEGEQIPTFEEVLDLVLKRCGLVVEIKEVGIEAAVCEAVREHGTDGVLVVSFYPSSLEVVREILPQVKTGLIFSRPLEDPIGLALSVGAGVLLPRVDRLGRDLVVQAHAHYLHVVPWVLNTEGEVRRAAAMGADGFATDDPCAARRWVEALLAVEAGR
ncbi:glycerophosphoryl diester phosphodiesterase [Methanofollis sp. W23]|uniref:glycerophosphodiester phosphodiesterase n=1 Tax=Methanofollis sp. W23 TaxID=2817849 RepID=UPI001AE2110D|nr:glycerophosphodiester phosphodiesterase family protein [Methanofollis sp. W23]MBP2145058.1 glycerophosphoryl diester phosphodiesterase [Methanofollis sp. W23]